jgi:hypothetical protein
MPTKVRLIRLLRDFREDEHLPVQSTPLKPAMLCLMELRSHVGEADLPSKHLVIPVESKEEAIIPQPVKIAHLPAYDVQAAADPQANAPKQTDAFTAVTLGSV